MTTLPSDENPGQRMVSTDRDQAQPLIQSIFGVQMPQSDLQLASSATATIQPRRHHRHHRHSGLQEATGSGQPSADPVSGDMPAVSVSEIRAPQTAAAAAAANVAD